jgi:conjugative transposon TraJ protein
MDFDNLHQVLRNLYQEMMPLCGDMIGVAKGIAGLGALFYVAYRVWKALASAEPIDVFPLLRPFAIGLCVMFFPTVVLGTINAVMSPVVQGTHAILEGQTLDLQAYQQQKDDLEAEARRREGKAWLVDDEVYEQRLADMGITDLGEIISMWAERTWYDIKAGFRQLVRDFFELLFNAAGLTIDTLRTFFLVVLSILGPLSFALSIYDGFHIVLLLLVCLQIQCLPLQYGVRALHHGRHHGVDRPQNHGGKEHHAQADGERPQEREHVDRLRAGQCLPYPVSHVKERTQAGDTFRHPDHVAA